MLARKLCIFFSILFIGSTISNAKIVPYSELGIAFGGSYYTGELNHIQFNPLFIQPAGGVFYRRTLTTHFSWKVFGNYARIKGSDQYAFTSFEKNRNLNFKSEIYEAGLQFDFNFYEFALLKEVKNRITPYIFGGLNYFYFNPKAQINGTYFALQPLGTEGQGSALYPNRKRYSKHQISMPFGLGVKTKVNRWAFGFEWGFRKTFTDYLDDVSKTYVDPAALSPLAAELSNRSLNNDSDLLLQDKQRGNEKTKDWYYVAVINISYKLVKQPVCRDK